MVLLLSTIGVGYLKPLPALWVSDCPIASPMHEANFGFGSITEAHEATILTFSGGAEDNAVARLALMQKYARRS